MSQFKTSKLFDAIFLLIVVAGLLLTVRYRYQISDWIFFRTHHPTAQTLALAQAAGLNDNGQYLLLRTDPQLVGLDEITRHCDADNLGCIDPQGRSFILIAPGKYDQAVVTAAHEMLHLAYRRLSGKRRDQVDALIEQALSQNSTPRLQQELQGENDAGSRDDEAHSLLGTEYTSLPPALESYYHQYFSDRTKVVAAQQRSQSY